TPRPPHRCRQPPCPPGSRYAPRAPAPAAATAAGWPAAPRPGRPRPAPARRPAAPSGARVLVAGTHTKWRPPRPRPRPGRPAGPRADRSDARESRHLEDRFSRTSISDTEGPRRGFTNAGTKFTAGKPAPRGHPLGAGALADGDGVLLGHLGAGAVG